MDYDSIGCNMQCMHACVQQQQQQVLLKVSTTTRTHPEFCFVTLENNNNQLLYHPRFTTYITCNLVYYVRT